MKSRLFLYTVLFGNYDDLTEHEHPKEFSFCFTDRFELSSKSWTLIKINEQLNTIDDRIRLARYYKANPHIVLPPHEFSLWVDASLRLNNQYLTVLNFIENSEIATFKYPDIYGIRTCAYDEARACIKRGKDAKDIIEAQMERYKENGFPTNYGLVETTILFRKNTDAIRRFNEFWWKEISSGSRRDQLSFNYTCWSQNISYSVLPGHRLSNPFSTYVSHKEQIYSGNTYSSKVIRI